MSRLETASRSLIEARQLARLQLGLMRVLPYNLFYQATLFQEQATVNIEHLQDLQRLPFTSYQAFLEDQRCNPPFGTNLTYPLSDYLHLYQPLESDQQTLKTLDTRESWNWWADCWDTAYRAVGVGRTDILLFVRNENTLALWSAVEGARRIGALACPLHVTSSVEVLKVIREMKVSVVICPPDFAEELSKSANLLQEDPHTYLMNLRMTIQVGEPTIRKMRIKGNAWDVISYSQGMMDNVGLYSFACSQQAMIHINEAEFLPEILSHETLEPVQEGEVGELVLTNLGRWGMPALRYRTGYLVEHGGYNCPCGRSYLVMPEGILGRVGERSRDRITREG